MRVLVLHGWNGSGPGHWQRWVAEELRARPATSVRFPQLPACDAPCPDRWGRALHDELAALAADPVGGERVVCCHSLACVLWLREAVHVAPEQRVDRCVLVAPPGPRAGVPELAGFYPTGCEGPALAAAARTTRLVYSCGDPYCPGRGAIEAWGEPLGLHADCIDGGGHLNVEVGYGPWPAMLEWILGEREDVVATVYSGAKNGVET